MVVKKENVLRFHCLLTQGRVCFLELKEPDISVLNSVEYPRLEIRQFSVQSNFAIHLFTFA